MANRGITIGPPRFAVAVHAIVGLTQSRGVLSSSAIASQVNSHATFLRRVLQNLAHAGLVEAREGREGGYILGKSSCQITLADIYLAVKAECPTESEEHSECAEKGKQLNDVLETIFDDAEKQTIDYLSHFTIADIMDKVDFSQ
ncbi:AsnC family transcriptional regulator [Paenibacillus baekrokdamisoli]|uniref:AsnC family transcriptional regulator n=1 Tax=Paenibacillus baekrokdamisoli TaxID=1712516 RepID=A0A3G9JC56_9BACL|nr:Rrf2 family transcriptional regulator [Paenibacillus baekrokdamisoli]MBB3072472.1 Rrf2 family protein [Paenibacillus baekrokdamisoli]BBH20529.1 AsnC family transcriptional regulator [Paenibacillus baekrokdamisoli]